MKIPFFGTTPLRKIVAPADSPLSTKAEQVLRGLLAELPEMLMGCVVEMSSGRVLASYTTAAHLNPNKVSLLNAKLLRQATEAIAARRLIGGPLTDITVLLEDQLHNMRPSADGQTYCFLAVHSANTNLGMVRELMRRQMTG